MNKRLRLSVFRSNKYIYGQIIDDSKGVTLAAAKGTDPFTVGKSLAEKGLKVGVKKVGFDRRHYQYHGRVKALAEGARKGGLKL